MTKRLWLCVLAGLIPWGAAAIFTNWYNERQPDGIQTLSVGHAFLLMVAQFVVSSVLLWIFARES